MGVIRWICGEGDKQVTWEERDTESLESARRMIESAFEEGRGVFAIGGDGVGVRLTAFDPAAREIVVIPQVRGG